MDDDLSKETSKTYRQELAMLRAIDGHCADLPVELIAVDRNVRQEVVLDDEFLESVRAQGVLQPILVTVVDRGEEGGQVVVCIAGQRRLAAARKNGQPFIKCVSRKLERRAAVVAAVSENVNRSALHPLDLADAFQELELREMSRKDMEAMFDRDQRTVGRFLKMAKWTALTKELIRSHPKSFTSRFLLALASRRMTPHEVERIVHDTIHKGPGKSAKRRPSKRPLPAAIDEFCRLNRLTDSDRTMILDALRHLGILPKAGTE